uniref:Uncharacterized protein n=1 Tax=Romanomermis culicivorax TaxID=13658 RepID=A0A915JQN0_ROMCU
MLALVTKTRGIIRSSVLIELQHKRIVPHFGANFTLAPVSIWCPFHFGARLTLASNVVGAKTYNEHGNHCDQMSRWKQQVLADVSKYGTCIRAAYCPASRSGTTRLLTSSHLFPTEIKKITVYIVESKKCFGFSGLICNKAYFHNSQWTMTSSNRRQPNVTNL